MKNYLCLNYGSSSLKASLFRDEQLIHRKHYKLREFSDYSSMVESCINHFKSFPVDVILHRVVHGLDHNQPLRIDKDTMEELKDLARINPLHNAYSIIGIEKCMEVFPDTPQYAVFDTSFHSTIPEYARVYGIPYELYQRGIKRYGFHGLSYAYLLERVKMLLNKESINGIFLHLGNGASVCAIKDSVSVDTSMGYTPLEGLLMGSRPGDVDPGVILKLVSEFTDDVEKLLYENTGLKALCGTDDMKEILDKAESTGGIYKLALDAFVYRVKKYIGAYWAILGKVDCIVFSGGIGENSPVIREKVCSAFESFGLKISKKKNYCGNEEISSSKSRVKAFVIKTDEELQMVRELKKAFYKPPG